MGSLAIDERRYGRILAKILPRVITDAGEYERMLGEVEALMDLGEKRNSEQDLVLALMVRLVEDYEARHMPAPDPTPHQMLLYLMEQRNLKQADLLEVFKSRGYASDVVSGKRAISKSLAKQLAGFFQVEPGVFI